ncbi:MFS transporter [Candidatus Woesebacteria bacterium]|nr:MFS transporter [Candidatus Woesebacteria bacterium]
MLRRDERTNIQTAYILSFLGYIYFPASAWIFFYQRYMSYTDVALLAAIGGIATTIFEIPSGAFADIVGRRTALILSYLLYTVAMFGEAFSNTFLMFAVFTVISSLVNSLYSGSLEALVYDTLKEDGHEHRYDKVISKMESMMWLGMLVGVGLGGFMYTYWFRMPFIAQGFAALFAAVAAFMLVEPKIDSVKYELSDMIWQNVQGFKELFKNANMSLISLLFITLETGLNISFALLGISQAAEYGLDARGISILFAIGYLISAGVSFYYPRMRQLLGTQRILLLSIILIVSSFVFAQFVGLILGSILIIARIASSTVVSNTRSVLLNQHITSKNRATSISTMVLLSHLPYTLGAYFVGLYIEQNSANAFAFIFGIIMVSILLLLTVFSFFYQKNKKLAY